MGFTKKVAKPAKPATKPANVSTFGKKAENATIPAAPASDTVKVESGKVVIIAEGSKETGNNWRYTVSRDVALASGVSGSVYLNKAIVDGTPADRIKITIEEA